MILFCFPAAAPKGISVAKADAVRFLVPIEAGSAGPRCEMGGSRQLLPSATSSSLLPWPVVLSFGALLLGQCLSQDKRAAASPFFFCSPPDHLSRVYMYLSLPRYREGKIDHFGQDGAFAPNPPRYPGPSPPYFPTLFPTTRSLRTPLLPSPGPPDEHDYDYDDEADGDDGFDEVGETIMAIAMAVNKTVGCAYYVAVEGAMWILDDVPMVGVEFVEALLRRLQPTTVIIPSRAPDSLVKCVESGVESYEANGPGEHPPVASYFTQGAELRCRKRTSQQCIRATDCKGFRFQVRVRKGEARSCQPGT